MVRRKTVKVPEPLWYGIREHSKREKIPMWQVIQRAWTYWLGARRSNHAGHAELDKLAWYIYKLSASVGEFRANPTENNLAKLTKTCEQISQRLGVDTSLITNAATSYMRKPTNRGRMALNDSTKAVIIQILTGGM